jgi:hypothetical protein
MAQPCDYHMVGVWPEGPVRSLSVGTMAGLRKRMVAHTSLTWIVTIVFHCESIEFDHCITHFLVLTVLRFWSNVNLTFNVRERILFCA